MTIEELDSYCKGRAEKIVTMFVKEKQDDEELINFITHILKADLTLHIEETNLMCKCSEDCECNCK